MNKFAKELINVNFNIVEFEHIIEDITSNPTVQIMKLYMQHCDTTCFDHCKNVAFYSFLLCKKFNLDYVSAARGAMLHDLFLYDWRKKRNKKNINELHAFVHPKIALENSLKLFSLNDIEKDVILKHMWPLTVIPPKYIESYIITLMDKFCAIKETIDFIKRTKIFSLHITRSRL